MKPMIVKNMFGVVLWSDASARSAVIWCEDHGNLAYYTSADVSACMGAILDPGDLVQFDLNEVGDVRHASNPQIIGASLYPSLPRKLQTAARGRSPVARRSSAANDWRPSGAAFDTPAGPKLA